MTRWVNGLLICGWVGLAPAVFAASATNSLTIGYSSFSGAYGPLWVAVEEQLGKKHGLELKAIYAESDPSSFLPAARFRLSSPREPGP
jgi:ABC-type nitrate/sulfonate/bicarbonate transport system substrate-binding protein